MGGEPQSASCQRCHNQLGALSIDVAGAHRHEVRNPGGHRFVIACFSAAPGCLGTGQTCHEASWFPGMTWQRAYCRQCSWHVGWLFRDKSQSFYGLDCERVW